MSSESSSDTVKSHAKSAVHSAEHVVAETGSLVQDALMSGCWRYPLQGIIYLVSRPNLVNVIGPSLWKFALLSAGVTVGMFFFTYLPQVAICTLFSGPLSPLVAAVLVLGESYLVVNFFARGMFLSAVQDDLFDAVLLLEGHESLVAKGRELSGSSSKTGFERLGKTLTKSLDRFSGDNIVRYIISLPLNAIPIVGTVSFIFYNGMRTGPSAHARYFQLKGFDKSRRATFVERRKAAYTAFGSAALVLNMIPFVGLVFSFTSTIGAAIWASKLEKKGIAESE